LKSLYPQGHNVYSNDLLFAEEAREFEDRQRILSIVGDQFGVVSGFEVTDVTDLSDNKVAVSAGLAIDAQGYRLNLASATMVTGIAMSDIGSHIAVYLDNTNIFPTAHPVTSMSANTREIDGVQVVVTGDVASGDGWVKLACVSNVVTGIVPSIELTDTLRECREELRIDPNRLGTGSDVAEHRKSAHISGISGSSGASIVPSIVDDATDYITFSDVQTDEWISIDGILLGLEEANPVADVMFNAGSDLGGLWTIYINSSGSTGKTQAALIDSQFLIATVTFDSLSGDLTSLLDSRVFYETTQDNVRVDLVEAETNDSLTAVSTSKNNMNRIRYRIARLEDTGRTGIVIANSGGDFNGTTDAVFTQAIASLPASGGIIFVTDGIWDFSSTVSVNKPVRFSASEASVINVNTSASPNTTFSITGDDCHFENFTFSVDVASGNSTQHILSFNSVNHGFVNENTFEANSPGGGNLYGEMILIDSCAFININNNHMHSESGQMEMVRVDSSGACSGLKISANSLEGLGCANLFHMDSGNIDLVSISRNQAFIGTVDAKRTWILSDSGTTINCLAISDNQYYNINNSASTVPRFADLAHIGDAIISSNSIRFTNPGTTRPIAIDCSVATYTVCNNLISNADTAIGVTCNDSVFNGNNIIGASGDAIIILGDDNTLQGNIVRGSGDIGIRLFNANNTIVDGCNVAGFTNDIAESGGSNNFANEAPGVSSTANITLV